jgi:DNA-binding response OmpR family regulator
MAARPTQRGIKVLVVDDDATTLSLLTVRLENAGYEVVTNHGALGTAATVMREQPDIVLLDVTMPALDGGRVAQMLGMMQLKHHAGVIFYSGKDPAVLEALARECGALGFISKTSSGSAFIAEMERLVQLHLDGAGPTRDRTGNR